jgi:hypothetical protein
MKICWDNLKGVRLTSNGYFCKNGSVTYVYMSACEKCGEPYLMSKQHPTSLCSKSCRKHSEATKQKMSLSALKRSKSKEYIKKLSESRIGERCNFWKGGVSKLGLPLYDTYAHQLWIEETRPVFKNGFKLLEVKCTKCRKWFMPTIDAVQNRMKFLNEKITSECRFYCSDDCKEFCDIFGQYKYPKGYKKINEYYTKSELDVWRKEVLKRANYLCEYCGEKANIAHHTRPKKLEPFFVLDPDYGMACCKECHIKYGHRDECSTRYLAMKTCK